MGWHNPYFPIYVPVH